MANIKDVEVLARHIVNMKAKKEYTIDQAFHVILKGMNNEIAKLESSKNDVFKAMRRQKNLQKREVF